MGRHNACRAPSRTLVAQGYVPCRMCYVLGCACGRLGRVCNTSLVCALMREPRLVLCPVPSLVATQNFYRDRRSNNLYRDKEFSITIEEPWVVCRDRDSLLRQASASSCPRALGRARDLDHVRACALVMGATACTMRLSHALSGALVRARCATLSRHKATQR